MLLTALKSFYRIAFLSAIAFFFLSNISFPQQNQITKNYRFAGIILKENGLALRCTMLKEKRKQATISVSKYYDYVLTPWTHVIAFNTKKIMLRKKSN